MIWSAVVKNVTKCYNFDMENYDELWGYAEDHFGMITVSEAKELGVPNAHLVMMERRGTLTRIGCGVYQVKHHVVGPNDAYAVAVAKVGEGAYLRGASVLGLLRIVPTDLGVYYVGIGRRCRKRLPDYIRLADRTDAKVCMYEGIRCEELSEAIISAANDGALDMDRILEAREESVERGLIDRDDAIRIAKEVRA